MIVKARAGYVRQSPFKVRLVLDLIRGLPVDEARSTLKFTNRRAAGAVSKVLESAVANAENNHDLDVDRLYIAEAIVGRAMVLKRWRPRARGSAYPYRRFYAHLTIRLRPLRGKGE